jgi:hypothetical protein
MNLEEKKLKVDILGKQIDIAKANIDVIHKRILVFLSIGAGSWIVGLEFAESENLLRNLFSIPVFTLFIHSGLGLLINMLKLSEKEKKLKILEKDLIDA